MTSAAKWHSVCGREVGWPSQNRPAPQALRPLLCIAAPGLCVSCFAVSGSLASPFYPPSQGEVMVKPPASPPMHGAGSTLALSVWACGPHSRTGFGYDCLFPLFFPNPPSLCLLSPTAGLSALRTRPLRFIVSFSYRFYYLVFLMLIFCTDSSTLGF